MKKCLAILLALSLVLCLAPLASAATADQVGKSMLRGYAGHFQWDTWVPMGVKEYVTFAFKQATVEKGKVVLNGEGGYQNWSKRQGQKFITFKVKAVVDPATRRIEIWESNPDSHEFTVAGSYLGDVNEDYSFIRAVWTQKQDDGLNKAGAQGTLLLSTR